MNLNTDLKWLRRKAEQEDDECVSVGRLVVKTEKAVSETMTRSNDEWACMFEAVKADRDHWKALAEAAEKRAGELQAELDRLRPSASLKPKYIKPAVSLIDGRTLLGFWFVAHPDNNSKYLWRDGTWRFGCGMTAGERTDGDGHYETEADALKAIAALSAYAAAKEGT